MVNDVLKNVTWKSLKKLANLNFSLFILFIILILCIIGSTVEQDQSLSYYVNNYSYYSSVILFLGLDNLFYTWWFICILFIFVLSLLSCTFFTQLPTLKNARRWKFIYNKSYLNLSEYLSCDYSKYKYSWTNIVYGLVRLNFFVFSRGNSVYAYKGLFGRIAPIFVHISIVAVMLGSIYSVFSSFVVQELIPIGETFHIKNVIHAGLISSLPSNLLLHVDNFYIQYNSNKSVKQFFSSINAYSSNKKNTKSSLIYVNRPLKVNDKTIYQTDWNISGMRINFGNKYIVQQRVTKTSFGNNVCWLTNFSVDNNKQIFLISFSLDRSVLLCDANGYILQEVLLGQKFYINNIPLTVLEVMSSTGIQIKSDPGIKFVYLGFFVIMISSAASYISYSQIWVAVSTKRLQLFGSTNRAILLFDQDMVKLQKTYDSYISISNYILKKYIKVLR